MKITYIHQHFKRPDEAGGGRPYEFARRLVDRGHVVTMICAGSRRDSYVIEGIRVEQLPVEYNNSMGVARRLLSFATFMARACTTAARLPADIVLASSTPLTTVVPGAVAATLRRSRFVLEIRDLWPEVPIRMGYLPRWLHLPARALERFGYRRADHLIALSPGMADGIRTVDTTTPVTVIPNCADIVDQEPDRPSIRADLGLADDDVLCVYAGSLGESYDPEWLGRLAVGLHDSPWRLLVVGDGSGLEPARAALREAGVPDDVFVGPKPRGEVFELLAAADVAVSSLAPVDELEHNSLNKVFDAMATSRPVLANHGGWLAASLDERHALLRVSRSPSAGEIESLVEQWPVERIRTAGKSSGQLGRDEFNRDTQAVRFEQVLTGSAV